MQWAALANRQPGSSQSTADAEALRQPDDLGHAALAAWEDLRRQWLEIRDLIEADADSDELDGRRRAAYSRIDRRTYGLLIDRMEREGEIGQIRAKHFREGLAIWLRHRNGRLEVAPAELQRLAEISAALQAT
jgi:hypothetical protein